MCPRSRMRFTPRCPRTRNRPMRRQSGDTRTTTNSTSAGARSTNTSVVPRCFLVPPIEIQSRVRCRRWTRSRLVPARGLCADVPELCASPPPALGLPGAGGSPPPLLDVPPPPAAGGGGFTEGKVTFGRAGGGGAGGGCGTGGWGTGGTVTAGTVTVGMVTVGTVIGGGSGGRPTSAPADATQPASSPGMKRAKRTARCRRRDLTA